MSAAVENWLVSRRRQVRILRATELGAMMAAGILIGRVYGAIFPPPEPTQWWSVQIQGDGAIRGPLIMTDGKGETLLKLDAGASLVRDGRRLKLDGQGAEIRRMWLQEQPDPSPPPARGREGRDG